MAVNTVFLNDIPFLLPVGRDAWHREGKPQLVFVSLWVENVKSMIDAAASDDVSKCLDYGKLYKSIKARLENTVYYSNPREVTEHVLACIPDPDTISRAQLRLPKAHLRAEDGFVYTCEQSSDRGFLTLSETLCIKKIKCACIIGVNPHERREKQIVVMHLTFKGDSRTHEEKEEKVDPEGSPTADIAFDHSHEIVNAVVKVRVALSLSNCPTSPQQA
jgi:dihydroneopterin aldolase